MLLMASIEIAVASCGWLRVDGKWCGCGLFDVVVMVAGAAAVCGFGSWKGGVSCLLLQERYCSNSQGSCKRPFVVFGVAGRSGRGSRCKRRVRAVVERDGFAACGCDAADGLD